MVRKEQLTYDVELGKPRRVAWGPVVLLGVVVVVAALLVGWVVVGGQSPRAAVTPSGPAPAPTAVAPPTLTAPPSPAPSGSDVSEELPVPEGSRQAADRFVAAWLDRNPKTRKPALEQVAVPALAEELMLTDPAHIPAGRPTGAPALDDASTYSVQFTQTLSTGRRIRVYLVADPQARYRWLATSVEQA